MTVTVDEKGVRSSSLAENLAEQQRRFRSAFGDDLSMSPQTPQGQSAGINALTVTEIEEAIVGIVNGVSIDHAGGALLTSLAGLLDIRKFVATKSRVTATLTGVAGVGVPAGSRAKTAAGDEFETLSAAVLSPSGVSVEMEAVESGPVAAAAGTLTQIITVIAGWETITNANAASIGINTQDDRTFRSDYMVRSAHSSIGPLPALKAALAEAQSKRTQSAENRTKIAEVFQGWTLDPNSIFVVAESGSDADVRRAVENHRGMGTGTMTGISGGTPDNTALDLISAGTISWNGTDYTGLDLTSSGTPALKAAALTTLLDMATPSVTISYLDGIYIAIFAWKPDSTPNFDDGTTSTAFGFESAGSIYPTGPYVRPRERVLTIVMTVMRRDGFPADGLDRIRAAVESVTSSYDIGQEVWLNDYLSAVESVGGTRVTALTVQSDGTDVSGVATSFDTVWTLPSANLTITTT